MAKKRTIRNQPRIPGLSREWGSSGLLPDVQALIARDAKIFRCSESWVRATIVTQHYEKVERKRFEGQARYDTPREVPQGKKIRRAS